MVGKAEYGVDSRSVAIILLLNLKTEGFTMFSFSDNLLIFTVVFFVFIFGLFFGFRIGERSGVKKFGEVLGKELPAIVSNVKCQQKCCDSIKK